MFQLTAFHNGVLHETILCYLEHGQVIINAQVRHMKHRECQP